MIAVFEKGGRGVDTSQREAQLCLWLPGVSTGNNRLEVAKENLPEYDRSHPRPYGFYGCPRQNLCSAKPRHRVDVLAKTAAKKKNLSEEQLSIFKVKRI